LSPSPCPRPTRASLRAAAMLWLLVPWIEITFFHLLSAFCLFKTPTASFQADAIVFWRTHAHAHTYTHTHTVRVEGSWTHYGSVVIVKCSPFPLDPPYHKHHIFYAFIRMDYPCHSTQHSSVTLSETCQSYRAWGLRACCIISLSTWAAFFFYRRREWFNI
jgi:hypothetical protein